MLKRFQTELQHPSADLLRVRALTPSPTLIAVQETKIGLTVGKLRQHASKDVQSLAKELVRAVRCSPRITT